MDLSIVRLATEITVVDGWNGMSEAAPIVLRANLNRQRDGTFAGSASLRVGYGERETVQNLEVSVPKRTMVAVLSRLAKTTVASGRYTPMLEHTDDYPSITIKIETPHGSMELETASQGPNYVPWGLRHDGKEYTVAAAEPGRALELLRPHIGCKRLEEMVDAVCNRGFPSSEPDAVRAEPVDSDPEVVRSRFVDDSLEYVSVTPPESKSTLVARPKARKDATR